VNKRLSITFEVFVVPVSDYISVYTDYAIDKQISFCWLIIPSAFGPGTVDIYALIFSWSLTTVPNCALNLALPFILQLLRTEQNFCSSSLMPFRHVLFVYIILHPFVQHLMWSLCATYIKTMCLVFLSIRLTSFNPAVLWDLSFYNVCKVNTQTCLLL